LNHVYKTVWNKSSGAFQVVSEFARRGGDKGSSSKSIAPKMRHIAAAALLSGVAGAAAAATVGTVDTAYRLDSNGGIIGYYSGTPTTSTDITWDGANLVVSGTITASQSNSAALQVSGFSSLTNNGTITSGTGSSPSGYVQAIYIDSGTTLGTLTNNGTINGASYAIYNDHGTITNLINTGSIAGAGIFNMGAINTLNNSGTISGGFSNYYGTIATLINSGTLSGGFSNYGVIGDLSSTGSMVGTITNNGTLGISSEVSITGNYVQSSSGTLSIGVTDSASTTLSGVVSETGYGRLVVSGNATIASGSSIVLRSVSGSYGFAAGQRFVVVQAAGSSTNYNASSLLYSATGYSGTVTGSVVADGSYSDLLLTLSSSSSGGSGGGSSTPNISATTPNAVSALSGLFNYSGVNASLLNVFNASAALGSTSEANRAGAQLSPASNAAATTQASSAQTQSVLNVAAAHVDGLRIAQADGASGIATGERANNVALWGQVFGGKATQDQRDNVSGYSANYNGLLIGGDKLLNDAWRLGALVSYANTSISNRDDNSGSSADLKSYGLIAYAGYTADSWYLDLSGGVVRHKYNTTRLIDFSGFTGTAYGNYNGTQSVLSAEAGYPIRLDATTVLTPIAGLNYSKLSQDGYTESGGNGAALTIASNNSTSLKSDLGAKLERSFATSYGSLAPSVQLTWRHEYHDTSLRSIANFAADTSGTTSFTTFGAKPIANTGIVALAATLTRSANMTLTARYTVEAGGGYMSQTADVRLRYQF